MSGAARSAAARRPGDTPERRESRRSMLAVSVAIHVVLLGLFPVLLTSFRREEIPERVEVVFYRPPARATPVERPAVPAPESVKPAPRTIAEPEPPRPTPRPRKPRTAPVDASRVAAAPPRPAPRPDAEIATRPPAPPTPRPTVTTGVFRDDRASSTAAPPSRQVRTAGFGTSGTTATSPPPRSNLRASARVGSFEIDPPDAVRKPTPPPAARDVATAGFGGGGVEAPPAAPARPGPSTVKTAGFGTAASGDPAPAPRGSAEPVRTGGFGDTVVEAPPPRAPERPAADPDTPVEILSKPRPVYTAEARDLRVEGEVVLDVVFTSTGEMRVLGVVEGLGHGLDQAAIDAARKIEFKPARRDGRPVDYTAVLRIVFQLA